MCGCATPPRNTSAHSRRQCEILSPPAHLKHGKTKFLITPNTLLIPATLTRWYEQLNLLRKAGKKRQEMEEHKNNFQTFRRGNQNCAEGSKSCALRKPSIGGKRGRERRDEAVRDSARGTRVSGAQAAGAELGDSGRGRQGTRPWVETHGPEVWSTSQRVNGRGGASLVTDYCSFLLNTLST